MKESAHEGGHLLILIRNTCFPGRLFEMSLHYESSGSAVAARFSAVIIPGSLVL